MNTDFVTRIMHDPEIHARARAVYRRLGFVSGASIGLGLALGTWGPDAAAQLDVPLQGSVLSILAGGILLVVLGALVGRLTAQIDRAAVDVILWLVAAVLAFLVIARLPYEGRTWLAWLSDSRFAGLPLYPYDGFGHGTAAFFIGLLFVLLGITQAYRLEGLRGSLGSRDRLSLHSGFLIGLHVALAFGVGLIADNAVNAPLRVAPQLVDEAIRTGRTYAGDLFELSLERGINYNAIAGVRDQLSANYTLQIGESDLVESQTVIVVAHFDNGAWINCRVLAGQLSHCSDASLPYARGFGAWLTGASIGNCRECALKVDEGVTRPAFASLGSQPRITRVAQRGSYVLMRVESPSGGDAVECLFHGISPVRLEKCTKESR